MAAKETAARDTRDTDIVVTAGRLTQLQRRWGVLLLLGIVQLIAGALALAIPVAATLAAAIVFGAVLAVAGGFQVWHAFSVRKWKGMALQLLSGALYLAVGVLVILFPVTGALTLTIAVAALLIGDGVLRVALAYRLRPQDGWGWFLAAGIASTAVGTMLLLGWPVTGLWGLGILLGVNLLFTGVINGALAFTFRARVARDPEREPAAATPRHA